MRFGPLRMTFWAAVPETPVKLVHGVGTRVVAVNRVARLWDLEFTVR